ncbi:tRNA pseudouridine(13) synthase TruD [Psychrosphaera aestuarii]|uniref:tRNA pseudouridine(13) synthase TruD n=1 Tax=Psychrosphaera aestuarii TaxID=1266052 RepID=UPI001B32B847|nr:tRNA pseudouridine(13) synthase TruD [Psychrosphaera aestuarii]
MSESNFFQDWDLSHWQYLHGKPLGEADFKLYPEDFVVTESLPFELTGDGENLYMLIEKRELNTQQVCQHLAKVLGKRLRDVGYAGLKDKQSVSQQWFSVQSNVTQELDLSGVDTDQVRIVKTKRHQKKLKVGALKGNHFSIRLRNVSNIEELSNRLKTVAELGVPNYFGLQRFGFKGNNLNWANRWADGESIRDKKIKGFALSAARSYVFNEVVSARIEKGIFSTPVDGDVFVLAGSNSYFTAVLDDSIDTRLAEKDIMLSAPMIGKGQSISIASAAEFEDPIVAKHKSWLSLLAEQGLEQQRRVIHLTPQNLICQAQDDDLVVKFELPSGAFATSVLRECVNFREQQFENTNK